MCCEHPVGLNVVLKLRAEEQGLRFSPIPHLASAARAPGGNAMHPYQAGVHTSLEYSQAGQPCQVARPTPYRKGFQVQIVLKSSLPRFRIGKAE